MLSKTEVLHRSTGWMLMMAKSLHVLENEENLFPEKYSL